MSYTVYNYRTLKYRFPSYIFVMLSFRCVKVLWQTGITISHQLQKSSSSGLRMRFAYIVEPALIGFILMTPHKWVFISRYSNMSPRLSRCSLAYLSVFRRHVIFDVGWCSYQAKSSNSVVLCGWSLEQVPSSLHPVSLVCPSICSRCLSTQKTKST